MNIKIRKFISKTLTTSILLSNMSIISFARTVLDSDRYEIFEGSDITIGDVLEERDIDVELEGNTLVNLIGSMDNLWNKIITKKDQYKYIDGDLIIPNNGYFDASTWNTLNPIPDIKPDCTYTLFFTKGKSPYFEIGWVDDAGASRSYQVIKDGGNRLSFVSPPNGDLRIKFCVKNPSSDSESINLGKVLLLEGDWVDKEMPEYFEGMKSIGEDDKGRHKIEILSTSKNLIEPQTLLNKELGGSVSMPQRNATKEIVVKPDILYTFTMKETRQQPYIRYYDENKNFIKSYGGGTDTKKVRGVSPSNAKYAVCYVYSSDKILDKQNEIMQNEWCLVEGENDNYISYKTNKREVVLKEPLRGLPGGVKDRIVKKDDGWYVERNCGEIILNGTEKDWVLMQGNWVQEKTFGFRMNFPSMIKSQNIETIYSDKFVNYNGNSLSTNALPHDVEMLGNDLAQIGVRILKTKLPTQDTNGFKEWLKLNPIKVVYQLAAPSYEKINFGSLQSCLDTTYISLNTLIPSNLIATVDRAANRAKECSEAAKLSPTTENLALARMWINLMKESTLKDEFNDIINNISDIEDLELEKKAATANLDIYIKSENLLSMSLSTNSIKFEDYSGVDEIEQLNAIDISINSSLPYSLNAYLPQSISNNDNSETMSLDILNIRENGNAPYQQFSNINTKLILNDSCEKGNNKRHSIDLKLASDEAHKADVYKTVLKFEVEQK